MKTPRLLLAGWSVVAVARDLEGDEATLLQLGMRSIQLTIFSLILCMGCSDKKKEPVSQEQLATCEANSDCAQGEVCLDGSCASTAPGAIYTNTENAVTPDKVKSEVERINEKASERADELLDGL